VWRAEATGVEALGGLPKVDLFEQLDPADDVATGRASKAVPAPRGGPDLQVWPAAIVVEGASTNQRLSLTTKLDPVASNDILDRMRKLEGFGINVVSARGTGNRHQQSSLL